MKERSTAGFIIYRVVDDIPEILLLYKDRWSPPKGGRESTETEMENALRETYEESGLHEKDFDIVDSYQYRFSYTRNCLKSVVMFLARIKDPHHPIRLSHEHRKYKWMRYEEALYSRNHTISNRDFEMMYRDVFVAIKKHISQYNSNG